MPQISWTELKVFEKKNFEIAGLWQVFVESIRDATHLLITADGQWEAMGKLLAPCGPDGHAGLRVQPDQLILQDCPVGALIGKFGGSSASISGPTAVAVVQTPTAPTLVAPTLVPPAVAAPPPAASGATPAASAMEAKPFPIGALCIAAIPTGIVGPLLIGFNCTLRPVRVMSIRVTVASATPTF